MNQHNENQHTDLSLLNEILPLASTTLKKDRFSNLEESMHPAACKKCGGDCASGGGCMGGIS